MISGIGYGQGLVSRPVGGQDAAATTVLRRFNQNVGSISAASAQSPIGLNLGEGRLALAAAVAGADAVIKQLMGLQDTIAKARGISDPSKRGDTNIHVLKAEAELALSNIDDAVSSAARGGANLIGTPIANIRISSPNGTVAVTIQPLTSGELGLRRLDLSSPDGVEAALGAVHAALSTATSRRELLAAVSDELGNSQRFSSRLASTLRELSLGATGRDLRAGAALDIRA